MGPLERLGAAPTFAPAPIDAPPHLRKLAEEFEASILSELLRPMFSALETDGLGGGGEGERMFRPMLVDQYAKGVANAGGIGLADMVLREMVKMQEAGHGADR